MSTRLYETGGKPATSLGNGIFEAKIIQSGWGSSGYYSPELLKEYGPSTFRAGRLSFANHPSEPEFANGRDITKIMAKLVTDAEYREEDASLWVKIKVKPEWIPFVEEYKDSIGMSIFASGEISEGEIEGRTGAIVESFDANDPYTSVDFVVAAGAGGKVGRMLESFNAQTKEALKSDREEQLRNLVRDSYRGERVYAWVRDFDPTENVVYFDVEDGTNSGTFKQSFSVANDIAVELVGEKQEVRVQTSYVPLNDRQVTEESASADVKKEKVMTPEEIQALVATTVAATVEALKPAPADPQEITAPTGAEIAEAVLASGLPEAARKMVYEAIENGTEVAAAIEAQKTFVAQVLEQTKVDDESPGRILEAHNGNDNSRVNIPGWSN